MKNCAAGVETGHPVVKLGGFPNPLLFFLKEYPDFMVEKVAEI